MVWIEIENNGRSRGFLGKKLVGGHMRRTTVKNFTLNVHVWQRAPIAEQSVTTK